MRALLIGDVIGRPGRLALERFVIPLRKELGVDLVVVNCENSAGGLGVTLAAGPDLRPGAGQPSAASPQRNPAQQVVVKQQGQPRKPAKIKLYL